MSAKSARVMFSSNLWVDVGLVNGAVGTIQAIEDHLIWPLLSWSALTTTQALQSLSHLFAIHGLHLGSSAQLPFKVAWAVTVHKFHGHSCW